MARCEGESLYSKREGEKRVTTKGCNRLREEFDAEGSTAQKRAVAHRKKKMLEDRGASLEEEGDMIRRISNFS